MSLCLIYQTKDTCYVGADTAISDGEKRLGGKYEKLYNHLGQLVFCAGLVKFSKMVRDEIEKEFEIDVEALRKYCLRNYGTEDWYYDENKKIICEIVVVKRINGIVHSYTLSSLNNFKIEETVIENDEMEVTVVGFNKDEVLETFKKHYYKHTGDILVNKLFKDVFNDSVCEVVGGELSFYALLEGNYCGIPKHTNKILQFNFKLNDKYRVNKINILDFIDNANLFLGTETDEDGVRRARFRLISEDGEQTLIDDRGLTLKDQVNFVDNLSKNFPIIIPYRVDEGVREVRKAIISLIFQKYRAFERGANSNLTQTSSYEGGINIVTAGGNSNLTVETPSKNYFTDLGGSVTDESGAVVGHNHIIKHTHSINIDTYHEHRIKQDSHRHTLSPHNHSLEFGVYEDTMPSECSVYLNNVLVKSGINSSCEIDVTKFIQLNKINEIKITSNTNGRIVANVFMSNFSKW